MLMSLTRWYYFETCTILDIMCSPLDQDPPHEVYWVPISEKICQKLLYLDAQHRGIKLLLIPELINRNPWWGQENYRRNIKSVVWARGPSVFYTGSRNLSYVGKWLIWSLVKLYFLEDYSTYRYVNLVFWDNKNIDLFVNTGRPYW